MFTNRYDFWSWRDTFAQVVVGLLGIILGSVLMGLGWLASRYLSDGAMDWPSVVLFCFASLVFVVGTMTTITMSTYAPLAADVAAISAIITAFTMSAVGFDGIVISAFIALLFACVYVDMYRDAIVLDEDVDFKSFKGRTVSWRMTFVAVALAILSAFLLASYSWFDGCHMLAIIVAATWYDRHVVLPRRIAERKLGEWTAARRW